QAFRVAVPREALLQPLAARVVGSQLADRLVALGDRVGIGERTAQPLAQRPAARWRDGAIEDAQERRAPPPRPRDLAAMAAESSTRRSRASRTVSERTWASSLLCVSFA